MIRVSEENFKKRIKCNGFLNNILKDMMEELGLSEEEALNMMLLAYYERLRSNGVNVEFKEVDLYEQKPKH